MRSLAPSAGVVGLLTGEQLPEWQWEGRAFSITRDQLNRWHAAFPNLHDLDAELQVIDDYFAENPPADGQYLHRISRWLTRSNADADRRNKIGVDW